MSNTTCINCFTINPEGANFCCICGIQLRDIGPINISFGGDTIDLSNASLSFATAKPPKKIRYANPPAVFMFVPLAYYHIDGNYPSEDIMNLGIEEMQKDGWEVVKVEGFNVRYRKISYYQKKRIG